jgi:hypothetical protein
VPISTKMLRTKLSIVDLFFSDFFCMYRACNSVLPRNC